MTTSWEFRVFVTKEAFSENVALQETLGKMAKRPGIGSWLTISKKREPRTDAYVAFQESKSYERCVGVNQLIESSLPSMIENKYDTIGDAHQVAPLVEVLSNAHDRLYTRLFNS